nr:hypothetical protein [uncultured Methanoregula sp.]
MKKIFSSSAMLLLAVLIVISAGIAGCTSQAPSTAKAAVPSPTPVANTAVVSPENLVLQPQEIPGNFTLVEQGERKTSELSDWARDHGWKSGYYVVYRKNDPAAPSGTVIRQNISVYAEKNATLAVSDTIDGFADWIVKENAMNQSVEKISIPTIGDTSGSLKYVNKGDNSGAYMIAFSKMNVFEDIQTNGTAADYETAKQLATIAAAKIR